MEITPKFSSLTFKRHIFEQIDNAVSILLSSIKEVSLEDIIKVIYAAQLCYAEISKPPKKENNWIDNINKKINTLKDELFLIRKRLENSELGKDENKIFKKICRKR